MEPITRSEQYLASIIGEDVALPIPQSRIEHYLNIIAQNGISPSSAGLINYDPEAEYPEGSMGAGLQAQAAGLGELKSAITPYIASGMVAPAALSVGDYVLANGTLYRVIADIANGATLTPDTNVTATTVAAELAALINSKVDKSDWIVNEPGLFLLSKILCPDYSITTSGRTLSKKFNRLSNVFNSSSSVAKVTTFTGDSVNNQTSTVSNLTSIPVANCIPLSVLATVRGDLYLECYSVSTYTGSTAASIGIFFWTVDGDTVTKAGYTALVGPANQRYTITKIPDPPAGATHFSLCQYTGGSGPAYDCVINIKIVPTTT